MNKTTTIEPIKDAPADVQEKIRAMFAAMDCINERIARDHEEMAYLTIEINADLARFNILLDQLKAGYK